MREIDYAAARRATTVAVLAVVMILLAQSAVNAAVTGGEQPLASVDSVPNTVEDGDWSEAPTRTVSLSKQQMAVPFGGGSIDEMDVQALTNETHVAIRLTWTDPTRDTSLAEPTDFSDAAAVMLYNGEQPPITMGAVGEPVNIWYWRAHWQYGADDMSEWTGDMYVYPHPANETKPGTAAGNPLARSSFDTYGQNYYASGFGSLTHAPEQNVHARAKREGDTWSVVFVREHTTDGVADATFTADEPMYMAFAAWNGSANDVNGKKSITLQFSTLDTASGELAAAETGGDSSSGDGGGDVGGSEGGDGASGGSEEGTETARFVLTIVAATVVSWSVIYWRAAR